MALGVGTRLGAYEFTGELGAGGMGEVYRATDTNLKRDVAIKILPSALAEDADRLARFRREAEVLASLNHPNIAQIYGLERSDGTTALVMELVEGLTLAERIAQGPMPSDEALHIAMQIADALEAAHGRQIVHRDLKPANIKLTPDGTVKVLDFGIAKALETRAGISGPQAPSLTTPAMTQAGIVLGTAAYMSPEQARGKPVDRRTDIWAFGCVLYEMLTGQPAFLGADVTSTLARVLEVAPRFDALPRVQPPVRRTLELCLEKDARKRIADISDVKLALAGGFSTATAAPVAQSRLPWLVAAASVLSAVAALAVWAPWRTAEPQDRPLIRLSVDLGPDAERDVRLSAVISPDGSRIVYATKGPSGFHHLYTRRLDQSTATLLTPDAVRQADPVFSPDGEWVLYWAPPQLVKVPSQGGGPVAIGSTPATFQGASWGDDGNIVIGSNTGLWRMPARGGTAELVKGTAGSMAWPDVLPGAKAVLVTTTQSVGVGTAEDDDIGVVQLATGEEKTLVRGGYWPRYLPTSRETGHLVYLRDGALYGVAFDPRSLTLLGTPTQLLNDVAADNALDSIGGQFTFSDNGTFVYLSGKPQEATYPISWLDASGQVAPVVAQPGAYGSPRISPDGKLLAYTAASSRGSGNGSDLWVYDLARGTPTQLTFAGEVLAEVAWARDSKHLVYQDGKSLWWVRSDGAGQKQLLLDGNELGPTPLGPRPFSFGPAGLAFAPAPGGLPDIWTLPLDLTDPEHPKPGKPESFLAAPGIVEVDPAFSPDGKFLAYTTNEGSGSTDEQVFVQPFPGPGGKWRISTAGGKFPAWSPATHEIFFLGGDDHIMVVSYTIEGDSFRAEVPRVWSPTPVLRHGVQLNFDISPDGKRVIMFPQPIAEAPKGDLHATFLLNFFDEVRRKAPSQ